SVAGAGLAAKPYAERAQLQTVQDHLERRGLNTSVVFDEHRRLHVRWPRQPGQRISVILSSSGAPSGTLLNSISASRARVVRLADNDSLAERICRAAARTSGDILLFVDAAGTPGCGEWLRELTGPLADKEIGIVGAKLLDPANAHIRHAGL